MTPYEMAIGCQDGVNLSGIVKSWATQLDAVWAEARSKGEGTEYVNTHPTTILILDKLTSLAGYTSDEPTIYAQALATCRLLVPQGCDTCGWTTSSDTPHRTNCGGTLRTLEMQS